MIDLSPKNITLSPKEKKQSALKMVILPLIGFILLVIIFAVFLLFQVSKNQQSILNWANISIIILSFLLIIPGSLFLTLTIGIIILLLKSKKPLQSRLQVIQGFVNKSCKIITDLTVLILKPVFFLESAFAIFHRPMK
jgi:hypothetical protein